MTFSRNPDSCIDFIPLPIFYYKDYYSGRALWDETFGDHLAGRWKPGEAAQRHVCRWVCGILWTCVRWGPWSWGIILQDIQDYSPVPILCSQWVQDDLELCSLALVLSGSFSEGMRTDPDFLCLFSLSLISAWLHNPIFRCPSQTTLSFCAPLKLLCLFPLLPASALGSLSGFCNFSISVFFL